jgi:hypothetical protein
MTDKTPIGIGGFLILPIIGLVITPIKSLLIVLSIHIPILTKENWSRLTTPGTEDYHPLWAPVLVGELGLNIFFAIFAIIVLILLFKKNRYLPKLIIIFYISNLILMGIMFYIANLIPIVAQTPDPESVGEITRAIIGATIWVPYFLISKRVKNTFV